MPASEDQPQTVDKSVAGVEFVEQWYAFCSKAPQTDGRQKEHSSTFDNAFSARYYAIIVLLLAYTCAYTVVPLCSPLVLVTSLRMDFALRMQSRNSGIGRTAHSTYPSMCQRNEVSRWPCAQGVRRGVNTSRSFSGHPLSDNAVTCATPAN